MRFVPVFAVLLVLSVNCILQEDIVRLNNGDVLMGVIVEKQDEGIKFKTWDEHIISIKWDQVSKQDVQRLRGAASIQQQKFRMLDGVRIITVTRVIEGIISSEDAMKVHVKTKDSAKPIAVYKSSIIRRDEIKVSELDAYSPEEIVSIRLTEAGEDLNMILAAADLAVELGAFKSALDCFEKALSSVAKSAMTDDQKKAKAEAITSKKNEIEAKILLSDILKLVEQSSFDEAITLADTLMQKYPDSTAVKENGDIVERIKKAKEEFIANRDAILSKKVISAFKASLKSKLRKLASESDISIAMDSVDTVSDEIIAKILAKYSCSEEEFRKWWGSRNMNPTKVSFGTGSWIVQNGQDGGYDYEGEEEDTSSGSGGGGSGTGNKQIDDLLKRFGQGREKTKKITGLKLLTKEEWWQSAGTSTRAEFLEALWAKNSDLVSKEESTSNCMQCAGKGTYKAVRGKNQVDVICFRCHGTAKDLAIIYK